VTIQFAYGFLGALLTSCIGLTDQTAYADDQPLTEQVAIQSLDAYVRKLVEDEVFSGTMLWAKDGKILYSAAYGLANRPFNVPNNLKTKFNLASLNKMFTSTAIMQLVESGKLSLTDTLDTFVDESWLPNALSGKIQIQHLLTHSSGLGSYFTDEFFDASKARFAELEDFKPLIKKDTLKFEPGTGYRYSNNGMLLLGVVIEAVTGDSYFDHVRSAIYTPAGMINSGCFPRSQPTQNLAVGYHANPEKETGWENNYLWIADKGGPAGGCYSTVEDLHAFSKMLIGHKLLSRENTEIMHTLKPEFHEQSYGYGFKISGTPTNRIVGHRGGFIGMSSNLDIFLDSGYISVVLSNHSGGSIPVYNEIRRLVDQIEIRNPQ